MPTRRLTKYLDDNQVQYLLISHSPAYTAQAIAQRAHVSGKELAKSVILTVDGRIVMAVLPATHKVNVDAFREAIGAKTVAIAHEEDFADTFPGCELGAMPPFGNLWEVPVFVDERLAEDEYISFNAGSHTELVQMRFDDFKRLARPTMVCLTRAFA